MNLAPWHGPRGAGTAFLMQQVAVIGAGAWGTALGKLLADKGFAVRLHSHRDEHARAMAGARENVRYLPGFAFPETLEPTSDMEYALRGAELVVLVVPSHALRATLEVARPYVPSSAALVS